MNAPPLSVGQSYCRGLPDGRILDHVQMERLEDEWAESPFIAAPACAEVCELFDRADELARGQIIPLWEKAADAMKALHLQVIEQQSDACHGGLRVFVTGNEAAIAAPRAVS